MKQSRAFLMPIQYLTLIFTDQACQSCKSVLFRDEFFFLSNHKIHEKEKAEEFIKT